MILTDTSLISKTIHIKAPVKTVYDKQKTFVRNFMNGLVINLNFQF